MRWRGVLFRLLLLGASLAVSLVLCEVGLRVIAPGDSPASMDIYQLDAGGGPVLRPSVTRRHLTSEWNVNVAINADGLRDRAAPLPDTNGRILAIGDLRNSDLIMQRTLWLGVFPGLTAPMIDYVVDTLQTFVNS